MSGLAWPATHKARGRVCKMDRCPGLSWCLDAVLQSERGDGAEGRHSSACLR